MTDRLDITANLIALSGEPDPRDRDTWDDVQLLPDGEVKLADGSTVTVDEESAERVVKAFAAQGADLSIDIEHAQLPQHPGGVPKGQPAPSYGWMRGLTYKPGRGITAKVSWTDDGSDLVKAQKYKYLSPVIQLDGEGNLKRIHSAGLTHRPAIQFAEALRAASETLTGATKMPAKGKKKKTAKPWAETLKALQEGEEPVEGASSEGDLGVLIGEIKAALGIQVEDGASLTQMLMAIRDKVKGGEGGGDDAAADEEVAASLTAIGRLVACAEGAKPADILTAVKELKAGSKTPAELKALSERLAKAEATLLEQETQALVAKYTGADPDNFKINPDDAEQVKLCNEMASDNPERFEKWMDTLPVVVQQGTLASGNVSGKKASRSKVIAASEREYDADDSLARMGTTRATYHNQSLREAGLKPLTEEELNELAA